MWDTYPRYTHTHRVMWSFVVNCIVIDAFVCGGANNLDFSTIAIVIACHYVLFAMVDNFLKMKTQKTLGTKAWVWRHVCNNYVYFVQARNLAPQGGAFWYFSFNFCWRRGCTQFARVEFFPIRKFLHVGSIVPLCDLKIQKILFVGWQSFQGERNKVDWWKTRRDKRKQATS